MQDGSATVISSSLGPWVPSWACSIISSCYIKTSGYKLDISVTFIPYLAGCIIYRALFSYLCAMFFAFHSILAWKMPFPFKVFFCQTNLPETLPPQLHGRSSCAAELLYLHSHPLDSEIALMLQLSVFAIALMPWLRSQPVKYQYSSTVASKFPWRKGKTQRISHEHSLYVS